MAKYDTYELKYRTAMNTGEIEAKVTVLFEAGDNIDNVMNEVRDRIQARILNFQTLSKLK